MNSMNWKNYEVEGQMSIFDLSGMPFGKMCQVPSVAMGVQTSDVCLKNWQELKNLKYQYLCLNQESGKHQERLLAMDGVLLGEQWMLNIGECPSEMEIQQICTWYGVHRKDVEESVLSLILEDTPLEKYCLSQKACEGILRRAEKRGKNLPDILRKALERGAKGEK